MGILSSLHDEQDIKMHSMFCCHWSIPSISNRKHFKAKKKKWTWEIQIRMILSWNKKPLNPNQKKMDTLLFCFGFFFFNKNDENILA